MAVGVVINSKRVLAVGAVQLRRQSIIVVAADLLRPKSRITLTWIAATVVVAKAQDGIAEREIAADCRCGITTIPMDRRHHRQSTGDFTKLRIGSLPIVDLLSKADPQSFHLQRAHRGDANRRGRYSQQYLCVWRI